MQKTIEMPEVTRCDATACVYNRDSICRARAITVGNSEEHLCDTMMLAENHTQRQDCAGVGACRSTNCGLNEDYECQAERINVIFPGKHAMCGTFTPE